MATKNSEIKVIPVNKKDKTGCDNLTMHENICKSLHDTYVKKNLDYGNSFGVSFEKYGIISALTRMSDKWNRLENLIISDKEANVKDEKIEDTLLDLANYCIMTYMELQK